MINKQPISTYYITAKELVNQRRAKDARAYVLKMLNAALRVYHDAPSILQRAKAELFLEKWIAISRDLYDKGVTDYVLESFGLSLAEKSDSSVAPIKKPATKHPKKQHAEILHPLDNIDVIDMPGVTEEMSKTQGWCSEIFESNKTSVVKISASSKDNSSSGTGFIVSQNGYLLTNDHVVYDNNVGAHYSNVKISFVDTSKTYCAKVLFSDKRSDLALCQFDPSKIECFSSVKRIANYADLKQGADCLVIGNAFALGLAPFMGIVRFTKNENGDMVHTAPSNPGDSGAPVFNRYGECIGINKSKTISVNGEPADAYANATPMDKIDLLIEKWIDSGKLAF